MSERELFDSLLRSLNQAGISRTETLFYFLKDKNHLEEFKKYVKKEIELNTRIR